MSRPAARATRQTFPAFLWLWLLAPLWVLAGLVQASGAGADFRVLDVGERTYQGAPSIAVILSQPLAETADPSTLIEVAEKAEDGREGGVISGQWIMAPNRRTLFFTQIEPNRAYLIEVSKQLTDAAGNELRGSTRKEVRTRALTAAAGFASQGLVLPKSIARGLPITSVNVDAVEVEFIRIKPAAIPRFLRKHRIGNSTSASRLNSISEDMGELAWAGRFNIDLPKNTRGTTLLPVLDIDALRAPGMYIALMRPKGRYKWDYTTTAFYVSDIGLAARDYADAFNDGKNRGGQLAIFANSLTTAQPLAGLTLSFYDNKSQLLGEFTTDDNGFFSITDNADTSLLIATGMVDGQEQVAVLPLDRAALNLSEFDLTGRSYQSLEAYFYSARDLYRPGETATISALIADQDGEPVKDRGYFGIWRTPRGRIYKQFAWQPDDGYLETALKLPATGPTGQWTLELRSTPESDHTISLYSIQVEDFMPERMTLELNAEAGPWLSSESRSVDVQGDWLYGAPAAGNRLEAKLRLRRNHSPSSQHPDFHFGDQDASFRSDLSTILDAKLDAAGRLSVPIKAQRAKLTMPIEATVHASLYEPGGRAINRQLRRVLWPSEDMIGVRTLFEGERADPDSQVGFELIRTNRAGELLAAKDMKVTVLREERDYYYSYSDGGGWTSHYNETVYPVLEKTIDIEAGGKARLEVAVDWGRYVIEAEDPANGFKTRYRFESGWDWYASDSLYGNNKPDAVDIKLDKAAYRLGDTATVSIDSPHAGRAMLLVEGDELLHGFWQDVPKGKSEIQFPVGVNGELERWKRHDLYVSVVVLRPGSKLEQITPQRAVGISHLPLSRDHRKLSLSIDAPERSRPERKVRAKLQVENVGLRSPTTMRVTLAAVDVGVLNITRFKTPDAHQWFFDKRRYQVDIRDIYNKVIEGADGRMAALAFGGDAEGGNRRPPANDVQIVSLFSGPVQFDANGQAEIELDLPDFDGRVRLMAMAFGAGQYGSAEQDVTIASPVIAQIGMPRFMANGDQARITLSLNNRSGFDKELAIDWQFGESVALVNSETPKKHSETVRLADGERADLTVLVEAKASQGVGELHYQVSGDDVAIDRRRKIGLRSAWPTERRKHLTRHAVGAQHAFDAALMAGMEVQGSDLRLRVSADAPIDAGDQLGNLLRYPYGCLEQTTSQAYPLLTVTDEDIRQFGIRHDKKLTAEVRRDLVRNAMLRLAALQRYNGGFGLWSLDSDEEPWLTPYVTDFLLRADRLGYQPDQRMLSEALDRLETVLRRNYLSVSGSTEDARHLTFASKAYGGYVLAQIGRAPLSSLRQLFEKERKFAQSGLPLVHLGLALWIQGDQRNGGRAILEGVGKQRADKYLGDYGSEVRDTALIIALLAEHSIRDNYVAQLIDRLNDELAEHSYLSTQDRYALFRAARALTARDGQNWSAKLGLGSGEAATIENLVADKGINIALGSSALGTGLTLTNTSDVPLYSTLSVTGPTIDAPAPDDTHISTRRDLYRLDGKPVEDGEALRVGDLVVAHVSITSDLNLDHAMLIDLVPAGLEIENASLSEGVTLNDIQIEGQPASYRISRVQHEEFRDDRYVAAISLRKSQTAHAFYLLRAVSVGDYQVPPVFVEDMYRPHLRGIGESGKRISVVE